MCFKLYRLLHDCTPILRCAFPQKLIIFLHILRGSNTLRTARNTIFCESPGSTHMLTQLHTAETPCTRHERPYVHNPLDVISCFAYIQFRSSTHSTGARSICAKLHIELNPLQSYILPHPRGGCPLPVSTAGGAGYKVASNNVVSVFWEALNLQDLKMADQKRKKDWEKQGWKMTDPDTSKSALLLVTVRT